MRGRAALTAVQYAMTQELLKLRRGSQAAAIPFPDPDRDARSLLSKLLSWTHLSVLRNRRAGLSRIWLLSEDPQLAYFAMEAEEGGYGLALPAEERKAVGLRWPANPEGFLDVLEHAMATLEILSQTPSPPDPSWSWSRRDG